MKSVLTTFLMTTLVCAGSVAVAQETNGMNTGETVADAAVPQNNAMAKIKDVPGLPRVLLIGDSISIAYTLPVRALLQGKANVHRIPVNGSATGTGVAGVKSWVGTGRWDVVVFNFGVHDAKLYDSEGKVAQTREGAHPATSIEAYTNNLQKIINLLKPTGASLIFATTTPIPEVTTGRLFDFIPPRNAAALEVMKANGVAICDLYSAILPRWKEFLRPGDVHFAPGGSAVLASEVVRSVEAKMATQKAE
ncbi:MAG: SGNH/GDSL hydrolase family protein [bacterium]